MASASASVAESRPSRSQSSRSIRRKKVVRFGRWEVPKRFDGLVAHHRVASSTAAPAKYG